MESKTKTTTCTSGLTLCQVLFIVFLVLKLTGQITWSWWWVTAPIWIPFSISLVFLMIILGVKLAIEKK